MTDGNNIKMGRLSTRGRPPQKIEYIDVECCDNNYTVGRLMFNNSPVHFVFDSEDKHKIAEYSWHKCSNFYIASSHYENGAKKELFLHNLVMEKVTFDGRGQKETVDHINRNPLDNRRCNLRVLTQNRQNLNQKKKPRRVVLPPQYNLNPNDLPKHVHYVPARVNHGDGFCVEFKLNGKKVYNPYIRSKVLSIEEKLEKIKVLLQKGYELYPEFNPEYEMTLRDRLNREYETIVSSCTLASSSPNTESRPSFLPGHVESNLKN